MQADYKDALRLVLTYEGGKVNNPADPGGRTNKGITQRVYSNYRLRKNQPVVSVYDIMDTEVEDIYRNQYANHVCFDQLPAGVDLIVFDGAVNSGPVASIKWLQRALGVTADGHLGSLTLDAATTADPAKIINAICDRRLLFMRHLRTWRTFGKGWSSRVAHVRKAALAMSAQVPTDEPAFFEGGQNRALIVDARKPLPNADAVWGAGASGGVISQVIGYVQPLAGTLPHLDTVVSVLTVGGAGLAVAGLAYSAFARSHGAKRADALDLTPSAAPVSGGSDVLPSPAPATATATATGATA